MIVKLNLRLLGRVPNPRVRRRLLQESKDIVSQGMESVTRVIMRDCQEILTAVRENKIRAKSSRKPPLRLHPANASAARSAEEDGDNQKPAVIVLDAVWMQFQGLNGPKIRLKPANIETLARLVACTQIKFHCAEAAYTGAPGSDRTTAPGSEDRAYPLSYGCLDRHLILQAGRPFKLER